MNFPDDEMLDLVIEVSGEMLPDAYQSALWQELLRLVPPLAEHPQVGVIPLRTAHTGDGHLLPKRARLTLRLPAHLAQPAERLTRQELHIGAHRLQLGAAKTKAIQPYPTLHAHLVASRQAEHEFMAWATQALADMGVTAKLICGRAHTQDTGSERIAGYSLVLHDLKDEDSLTVQYRGLGAARQLGCGLFVPYKAITGLE